MNNPWFSAQGGDDPTIRAAIERGDVLFHVGEAAKLINSKSAIVRIIGLSQSDAPPDKLARASASNIWLQRMAVARNPGTPPNILKKLTKDSNGLVALKAQATLTTLA